jgi:predicted site-specific integrase-resolvase
MSKKSEILIGVVEASEILGLTRRQVTRWCQTGVLPGAYKLNPDSSRSKWRIPRSAVTTVLDRREKQQEALVE